MWEGEGPDWLKSSLSNALAKASDFSETFPRRLLLEHANSSAEMELSVFSLGLLCMLLGCLGGMCVFWREEESNEGAGSMFSSLISFNARARALSETAPMALPVLVVKKGGKSFGEVSLDSIALRVYEIEERKEKGDRSKMIINNKYWRKKTTKKKEESGRRTLSRKKEKRERRKVHDGPKQYNIYPGFMENFPGS